MQKKHSDVTNIFLIKKTFKLCSGWSDVTW